MKEKGRSHKWLKDRRVAMAKMVESKQTDVAGVALAFDAHPQTVRQACKEHGVRYQKPQTMRVISILAAMEKPMKGETLSELAIRIGARVQQVHDIYGEAKKVKLSCVKAWHSVPATKEKEGTS